MRPASLDVLELRHLPIVRSCCDRDHTARFCCGKALEELLFPSAAEIAQGTQTRDLYVTPMATHWPMYVPALGRCLNTYDFSARLQELSDEHGDPDYIAELGRLCEEKRIYDAHVAEHGTAGVVSIRDLSHEEGKALRVVLLFVTKEKERGSINKGPTFNWKKTRVVRANYKAKDLLEEPMSARARAAYDWLMQHNPTYRHYVHQHKRILAKPASERELFIATYRLLTQSSGIEVAMYPLLYPWEIYSDSRVKLWARERQLVKESQLPSMKHSFLHKVQSRCIAYGECGSGEGPSAMADLSFLIYDMSTAQRTMAQLAMASQKGLTGDVIADNTSNSESYWRHEQDILCDVVRQVGLRRGRGSAYPNLFITIAPAEWTFPLHSPLFAEMQRSGRLSGTQGLLTLHIYELLMEMMKHVLSPNEFIQAVHNYVIRVEFQGRKTLHIHVAAWVESTYDLRGRTGQQGNSAYVSWLEELFRFSEGW